MRRWLGRLAGIFGVALLGVLFGLTPLGFGLEQNFGLRWLFKIRGSITPPSDVVVVGIDDQTGGHLGLSRLPREWPRSVHASLVEALVQRGASVIVFDFDFQTPKQPADDQVFANAIAASNRVVLTEKLIGKRQPLLAGDGRKKGSIWVEQLVAPMPLLADAAKAAGTFPLPKVDVAVHEFWTFKSSAGYAPTTPALALQLQAHTVYPELVKLLENADVREAAQLPRTIDASSRSPEIRSLMVKLRQLFEQALQFSLHNKQTIEKLDARKLDGKASHWLAVLIGLYAGDDNRYLNFYGPPGTIPNIPYHALLDKDDKSRKNLPDLTGKVVFVGYSDLYDPNQPDRFYTVYTNSDGVDLSGVEIAATAYSNLATNGSLSLLSPALTAAILLLFGAFIGGLIYLLPAIVSVPLSLMIACGYFFAAEHVFAQQNVWLPLAVPLLLQLPMAVFIGLGTQYLSERRKKQWATQAISKYIPESLVKEFTEKNLQSTALNKVVYSVCFASDMAGFTTISEQLPPKELAVFLNDYFESLSAPLHKNKVDVIEFRADGIMCAWTAESNFAARRQLAAMAALDAVAAIDNFSQRHPLLTQHLRIGLEVGMVYVGHSGGGGHYVYSIVGDCANTAARIEGLNKKMGTQVLASRSAVEDVDGLLTRYLGDFQFVGKSEALPIIEIMARKEIATEAQTVLCLRYQQAMDAFTSRRYQNAITLFEAILLDYPDDGPTRFHLAYCQQLALSGAEVVNPLIIHLDSK